MTTFDAKAELLDYLQGAWDTLLWKLEGLSEYDIRRAWQHSDATIAELPLDATVTVPWWGEDGTVTLGRIVVHIRSLPGRSARPARHLPGDAAAYARSRRATVQDP